MNDPLSISTQFHTFYNKFKMKEYIIHALDGTDADALERRLAVRPAHLKNMSLFKASGNFVYGGAMLDADGKMIGSTVVMRFESDDAFQVYMDSEPYISEKIWQDIKIYPFRLANVPFPNEKQG